MPVCSHPCCLHAADVQCWHPCCLQPADDLTNLALVLHTSRPQDAGQGTSRVPDNSTAPHSTTQFHAMPSEHAISCKEETWFFTEHNKSLSMPCERYRACAVCCVRTCT